MPYHIRKLPNRDKYKVYTQDGTPLSKVGLSHEQAVKQKIAVSIGEFGKKQNNKKFQKK